MSREKQTKKGIESQIKRETERSPERDSYRPRNGNLDRDRHRERQTGRQAQEKEHCLSIWGSQAEPGSWKGGCARHWAETSGLLG